MKPGISHMGMDQKSDPNGCNSMRHFGEPPFLVNDFTGRSESQRMVRITIGKKLSKRWPAFLMWELQWFARQIDEFDVWEVLQPINLCCRAQTGPTQWRMVGERVNLFGLRCTKTWYQDVYGVPSKNDWKGDEKAERVQYPTLSNSDWLYLHNITRKKNNWQTVDFSSGRYPIGNTARQDVPREFPKAGNGPLLHYWDDHSSGGCMNLSRYCSTCT